MLQELEEMIQSICLLGRYSGRWVTEELSYGLGNRKKVAQVLI